MTIDITPEAVERLAVWHGRGGRPITVATLRALSSALTASQAETAAAYDAVKVKPLVWFEAELPSRGGGKFTADGYTIRRIEGYWLLDFSGNSRSAWKFQNIDEAKAAAQADYYDRILAAIDTPADSNAALDLMIADAEERGMRKAVDLIYQHAQDCLDDGRFTAQAHAIETAGEILDVIPKGKDHE